MCLDGTTSNIPASRRRWISQGCRPCHTQTLFFRNPRKGELLCRYDRVRTGLRSRAPGSDSTIVVCFGHIAPALVTCCGAQRDARAHLCRRSRARAGSRSRWTSACARRSSRPTQISITSSTASSAPPRLCTHRTAVIGDGRVLFVYAKVHCRTRRTETQSLEANNWGKRDFRCSSRMRSLIFLLVWGLHVSFVKRPFSIIWAFSQWIPDCTCLYWSSCTASMGFSAQPFVWGDHTAGWTSKDRSNWGDHCSKQLQQSWILGARDRDQYCHTRRPSCLPGSSGVVWRYTVV